MGGERLDLVCTVMGGVPVEFKELKTPNKAMNWISVFFGLVTIGAGAMGCVWGYKVLKPWPPLTWNNFVGGVFMIMFGFGIIWMAFKEKGCKPDTEDAGFFQLYFKFLDNLLGRGFFFIFIGMRVVPLGKFYCLIAGICIFIFGFINIGVHFAVKAKSKDGTYSYTQLLGDE